MRTRTRPTKRYHATHLGAEGYGPTAKAARQDAIHTIERAMGACYAPVIIRWRGVLGILYCDRGFYEYVLLHSDSQTYQDGTVIHGCSCCGEDRKAALVSLKTHLAQITWKPEEGSSTVPFILKDCPEATHVEYMRQAAWQLAYRHAHHTLGLPDCDAHQWACFHSHDF